MAAVVTRVGRRLLRDVSSTKGLLGPRTPCLNAQTSSHARANHLHADHKRILCECNVYLQNLQYGSHVLKINRVAKVTSLLGVLVAQTHTWKSLILLYLWHWTKDNVMQGKDTGVEDNILTLTEYNRKH